MLELAERVLGSLTRQAEIARGVGQLGQLHLRRAHDRGVGGRQRPAEGQLGRRQIAARDVETPDGQQTACVERGHREQQAPELDGVVELAVALRELGELEQGLRELRVSGHLASLGAPREGRQRVRRTLDELSARLGFQPEHERSADGATRRGDGAGGERELRGSKERPRIVAEATFERARQAGSAIAVERLRMLHEERADGVASDERDALATQHVEQGRERRTCVSGLGHTWAAGPAHDVAAEHGVELVEASERPSAPRGREHGVERARSVRQARERRTTRRHGRATHRVQPTLEPWQRGDAAPLMAQRQRVDLGDERVRRCRPGVGARIGATAVEGREARRVDRA